MKFQHAKYFSFFLLFFSCLISSAQSPEGINYQAALRDSESGEALKNEMVFIVVTIRDGGPNGTIVYSESHSGIQTNDFGLINLIIGGGDATDGSFEAIPWASGNIWYEIEVDSGSGLESLGSSRFLSVPYALFAGNAEESLDNDPTNELITSAQFDEETQSIDIQEPGNVVNIPLEGLNVDDADADATNELISSALFNPENNTITLTQADGSEVIISLAELNIADADADPTNELIDSDSGLQLIGTNLVISEAGISYSVNLDILVEDEDADPTNELIDDEAFTLTNDTILTLSEAGIEHSVNLAPLREDGDWIIDEDQNTVYNEDQRVGIGTSSPLSTVQFGGSVGYDVTLLESGDTDNYTANADDHMIVINFQPLGNLDFGIFLPPASVCEGRVYTIRKTGAFAAFGEVTIDTGVFPVDFFTPNLVLDEFGAETAVLLSLGVDGWTRILREN
ncbi:hypothetical protein O3Q51_16480 [Cryomorphaceae bacterium 1068]|nr:hypothetical protein [Cryomorphaceae bacterium 1068]